MQVTENPFGKNFKGVIPQNYDRYLRQVFFQPYADDIARRVPPSAYDVLEVACGTGIVTEQLRKALPNARIVATDLSESMLDVARAKNLEGVEFQIADALALPFEDGSFDAVVCQFGLMLFPEQEPAACEAYRVLRPGGVWLASTWNSLAENPIADLANQVCRSFYDEDSPPFFEAPFSMYDPAELRRIFESAGFREVTVEDVRCESAAPTGEEAALGLLEGSPALVRIQETGIEKLEPIKAKLIQVLEERFRRPVRSPLSAWVCRGVK